MKKFFKGIGKGRHANRAPGSTDSPSRTSGSTDTKATTRKQENEGAKGAPGGEAAQQSEAAPPALTAQASQADFSSIDVPGYHIVKKIGHGGYGGVWLANRRTDDEAVAIKFVDPEYGERVRLQREILNHSRLKHPNIVQLYELLPVRSYVGLVMEYAPEGDLFEHVLQKGRPGLSEAEALGIFQQIIRAVDYMHQQGVVSRDIKLENCLLTLDSPPRVKLCDFGFSKSDSESVPNSRVGTPQYIPPELLEYPTYDGKKADVWSCGVLLYAMLAGQFPFHRNDDNEIRGELERRNAVLRRIVRCEYTLPRGLSPECCNLIANLLVRDPERRLSVTDIQRHAYFVRGLTREWFAESAALRAAAPPGEGLTKEQVEKVFRIADGGADSGGAGEHEDDLAAEHDELAALDD